MFKQLLLRNVEGVQIVTINRESTYNSLSTETKEELAKVFLEGEEDKSIKAFVLTGAGEKAFCSGQDLSESKEMNSSAAEKWISEFDYLYRAVRNSNKPIISAINGFSTGSGLQLALLTDIRIASTTAKFGMTEMNVGLPAVIGTTLFWEVMGKSRTVDLILTGELFDANKALEYGVVTRLSNPENLMKDALELAKKLGNMAPTALSINKRRFNQLSEEEFNRCMSYAIDAHTIGYGSGEPQEKMREFFEKRNKKK